MRTTAMPRGQLLEGRAAGRERRSRTLSPGLYHGGRREGRGIRVMVQTPQGRRCAGVVLRDDEGRLVLRKQADEREHLLRVPCEAWAVQASALREAELLGVERVEVHDPRAGRLWWCRLADFARFGVPFERGHGPQVALALRFFSFLPRREGGAG